MNHESGTIPHFPRPDNSAGHHPPDSINGHRISPLKAAEIAEKKDSGLRVPCRVARDSFGPPVWELILVRFFVCSVCSECA